MKVWIEVLIDKKCKQCGKDFKARYNRKIFCSIKCKDKAHTIRVQMDNTRREKKLEGVRKWRLAHPDYWKEYKQGINAYKGKSRTI